MAEERKRRRWPWIVVTMLILYPLSMGPALRYVLMYRIQLPVMEIVYIPLIQAARVSSIGQALAAYLNLWTVEPFRASADRDRGLHIEKVP